MCLCVFVRIVNDQVNPFCWDVLPPADNFSAKIDLYHFYNTRLMNIAITEIFCETWVLYFSPKKQ